MTDLKLPLSSHYVSVLSNTQFPHEFPFKIFCVTCQVRRGFPTQEEAEAACIEHRKAFPYVMDEKTFSQRLDVITRATRGMSADQLEIVLNELNADLTSLLEEER